MREGLRGPVAIRLITAPHGVVVEPDGIQKQVREIVADAKSNVGDGQI